MKLHRSGLAYCRGVRLKKLAIRSVRLDIQGEKFENKIFVLNGNAYRTDKSRLQHSQRIYAGTENTKKENRSRIIENIKQFNLLEKAHPEHYLWIKLKTNTDLSDYANEIVISPDKHDYLDEMLYRSSEIRGAFYTRLTDIVSKLDCWPEYVQELNEWLQKKKRGSKSLKIYCYIITLCIK